LSILLPGQFIKDFLADRFAGFFPGPGFAGSRNRLGIQQVTNLNAIVQVRPINRVAAGFERPVGALLGRGFGQPFQPRHFGQRQADFAPVIEPDVQRAAGKADALGVDLSGGFSGQSVHAMPAIVWPRFV